jgi:hypothetical protein
MFFAPAKGAAKKIMRWNRTADKGSVAAGKVDRLRATLAAGGDLLPADVK